MTQRTALEICPAIWGKKDRLKKKPKLNYIAASVARNRTAFNPGANICNHGRDGDIGLPTSKIRGAGLNSVGTAIQSQCHRETEGSSGEERNGGKPGKRGGGTKNGVQAIGKVKPSAHENKLGGMEKIGGGGTREAEDKVRRKKKFKKEKVESSGKKSVEGGSRKKKHKPGPKRS